MKRRTCTIVLVGENTANRKWIKYEITKSWNGCARHPDLWVEKYRWIYIKALSKGFSPGSDYGYTKKLSPIVQCYDSVRSNSKARYAWIRKYMESAVEEAIRIRRDN